MRHTATHLVKLCISLSALIASAAFTAQAQPLYQITDISAPDTGRSFPRSINSFGQVVADGPRGSYLYDDGVITYLQPLLGPGVLAMEINDSGDIAGDNPETGAVLYSRGVLTKLPTHPNNHSNIVDAMNNSGEITLHGVIFGQPIEYHGSIYSNGALIRVPSLGGVYTRAYGINDFGHVVGDSSPADEESTRAYLFRDGKIVDLGTLGGKYSRAYDINNRGNITGDSDLATPQSTAFIYRQDGLGASKMISLGILGTGNRSAGRAINNADEVVGTSTHTAGVNQLHGFLYKDGKMYDLNDIVVPDPTNHPVVLTGATDINDSGWIIAYGLDSRYEYARAYLLRPLN